MRIFWVLMFLMFLPRVTLAEGLTGKDEFGARFKDVAPMALNESPYDEFGGLQNIEPAAGEENAPYDHPTIGEWVRESRDPMEIDENFPPPIVDKSPD